MPNAKPAKAPRSEPAPAPAPAARANTTCIATPSTRYVAQTVRWMAKTTKATGMRRVKSANGSDRTTQIAA